VCARACAHERVCGQGMSESHGLMRESPVQSSAQAAGCVLSGRCVPCSMVLCPAQSYCSRPSCCAAARTCTFASACTKTTLKETTPPSQRAPLCVLQQKALAPLLQLGGPAQLNRSRLRIDVNGLRTGRICTVAGLPPSRALATIAIPRLLVWQSLGPRRSAAFQV